MSRPATAVACQCLKALLDGLGGVSGRVACLQHRHLPNTRAGIGCGQHFQTLDTLYACADRALMLLLSLLLTLCVLA